MSCPVSGKIVGGRGGDVVPCPLLLHIVDTSDDDPKDH
jgi:hypothetical protein